MSISRQVDDNHRLTAADLQGRARRVVVANVTFQGVEEARAVLHFGGYHKRLVLDTDQVEQMLAITGSALFADWIGHVVVLQPPARRQTGPIRIHSAAHARRARGMPVARTDDQQGWRLAVRVVAAIGAASGLYLLFTYASGLDWTTLSLP